MKKRLTFLFLIALLIGVFLFFRQPIIDSFYQSDVQLTEQAKAMIVMDAEDGRILFQQNHQEARPIASMSKMMTQYIVLHAIDSGVIQWDQQYTPSEAVLQIAEHPRFSNLQMVRNQSYSVRELFTAMTVISANDATVALAEMVGGTEADFVPMMNEQAAQMGLQHTIFFNATGLDGPYVGKSAEDTNRASAHDVAILAQKLLTNYPKILDFTTMSHFTASSQQTFWNTNLMLPNMEQAFNGIDGLKTGYTDLAGSCFTSTGIFNGRRIITVVMDVEPNGDDDISPKFTLTRELIEQTAM